jgi:RNA polymerase sigma-70 factor, ECF subfamily
MRNFILQPPADDISSVVRPSGRNVTFQTYLPMNTTGTSENVREQIAALLPRLRRFAGNLARDAHDADDVVQIAVERALTKLDQWRPDARLDGWMFGIVRNAWIDEVRSRGRRSRLFAGPEAGEHVGESSMDREADLLSAQAAMARLPEDQRAAVSLVLIEGLPYKEAAAALEIPIGTLTSRLARGRGALQAMLAPPEGVKK